MMVHIKHIFLACLPLMLSSCLLSDGVRKDIKNNPDRIVTQLQDQLVAVGVPKQDLKEYPYALVLAGQKYTYLVQSYNRYGSDSNQATASLLNIFKNTDLSKLYIGETSREARDLINSLQSGQQDKRNPSFSIEINEHQDVETISKMYSDVTIIYSQQSKIPTAEIKKLEQLGFHCWEPAYTHCSESLNIWVTITPAQTQQEKLAHTFRQPVNFRVFQRFEAGKTIKQKIFLPVATVVDIATFPVQALFCIVTVVGCIDFSSTH